MKKLLLLAAIFAALVPAGCGGGGGSDALTTGTLINSQDPTGGTGGGGGTTTNPAAVSSVSITTSPTQLEADGAKLGRITVKVLNDDGTNASLQSVTFYTNGGSFADAFGNPVANSTVATDSNGVAVIFLKAPTRLGEAIYYAECSGIQSTSKTTQFVAGPVSSLAIYAATDAPPGGDIPLTIVAKDGQNNPVRDLNITITSSLNLAYFGLVTTNQYGIAQTTYTTGSTGTDTLTAETLTGIQATHDITVSQTAGTLDSITLKAGATQVRADGTTQVKIEATVKNNDGSPATGYTVAFDTTLGGLSAASATTDANGVAGVLLKAPQTTGIAYITANVAGYIDALSVTFIPGPPNSIVVSSYPDTVQPQGSSTITAAIADANSNPIAGETINFLITDNQTGAVLAPTSAATDAVGRASITYTAGATTGVDTVKGTTTSNAIYNSTTVTASAAAAGFLKSIQVTAGASSVEVGGQPVLIRATLTDNQGQPASGATVDFDTTAGTLTIYNSVSNAQGIAETTLTSPDLLGTALITANAGGFVGSTSVQFTAGPVNGVSATASPDTLGAGGQATLFTQVIDAFGNPVKNESIQFYFADPVNDNQSGGSLGSSFGTTDANGRVNAVYTAGPTTTYNSVAAVDTITVSATNGTIDTVPITLSDTVANFGGLALTTASPSIIADGTSTSLIQALVTDTAGQPFGGVTVQFTTTQGKFSGTVTTTASAASDAATGIAAVNLVSATSPGIATVTAAAGGFNREVQVSFVPGGPDPANSSITASPSTLPADGTSTTEVTVLLLDANSNLVKNGTPVTLLAQAGTITSTNPSATASGRAVFTLQSPNTQYNSATLSVAEVAGLTGSVSFGTGSTGEPANIRLTVADSQISVAGVGQKENTTITVEILESNGLPIDEANFAGNTARISFKTQPKGGEFISGKNRAGTVVTANGTTPVEVFTNNGTIQLNLQAGTLPGPIEVQVEALGTDGNPLSPPVIAALSQVNIASGPPHTIALSYPQSNSIINLGDPATSPDYKQGFYRRVGTASVTDRYGNDVPDGTVINLGLLDSVITMGTTGQTTFNSATLTDGGGNFLADSITRNNAVRYIEDTDRVLIPNALAPDKSRFVGNAAARTATTLEVGTPYTNTASNLNYVVGSSLLGAYISGEDAAGVLTKGTSVVQNGLAKFWVTYPANAATILNGCYGYAGPNPDDYFPGDIRFNNPLSSQVYVVASASNRSAATVDRGTFCFAAIAGGTLSATPNVLQFIAPGTGATGLALVDGGDGVPLPFVPVGYMLYYDKLGTYDECSDPSYPDKTTCEAAATCSDGVSGDLVTCIQAGGTWSPIWQTGISSDFRVSVDMSYDGGVPSNAGRTDFGGGFVAGITVTGDHMQPGDTATVTFYAGGASVPVTIEGPK